MDCTELLILACRGFVDDEDKGPEISYGKDANNPLQDLTEDTIAFVDQILDLAKRDPAAAERQVDDLPQGSIAVMLDRTDFEQWQMARYLKDQAQAGDFEQMLGHLRCRRSCGIAGRLRAGHIRRRQRGCLERGVPRRHGHFGQTDTGREGG